MWRSSKQDYLKYNNFLTQTNEDKVNNNTCVLFIFIVNTHYFGRNFSTNVHFYFYICILFKKINVTRYHYYYKLRRQYDYEKGEMSRKLYTYGDDDGGQREKK